MTYLDTRINVWQAVAGRAPGTPSGPAEPGLWAAVAERLDPAQARPVLRAGIEAADLTDVRGTAYLMIRSPDDRARACYLRLTPHQWRLAQMMDGNLTVARLVAEFARIAGRLAPDEVRRLVADLAGNRMLDELPVDAFRPLSEIGPRPLPTRLAGGLVAVLRGRRMFAVGVDPLVTGLYRAGGRLFFTRIVAALLGVLAVAGLAVFVATWWRGSQPVFLVGDSYLLGAAVLVLLNLVALAAHEFGHALAAKHVGRSVPAAGLLVYFGIPSVFVDTTDVWMAGRRARLLVTAAGPATALMLAGVAQLAGLAVPALGPLAFKLAFVCYLGVLFNLNPFLALDGSYLLTDWLEIANLRGRGLAWLSGRLRRRAPRWSRLDREGRIVAWYGMLAVLWLVVAAGVAYRIVADRVTGLATGLWPGGPAARLLLVLVVLGLCAPAIALLTGRLAGWWAASRRRRSEREPEPDTPRRLAVLRASDLGGLPEPALAGLAARASWLHPPAGRQLVLAGDTQPAVYVVVDGALQGRKPGDPAGTIRRQVGPGGAVGLASAITGRPAELDWHTAGTTVLSLPTAAVAGMAGPLRGPAPTERAEAEALFDETPALAALGDDERLALITTAWPVDLAPGAAVILPGPTHAVVVDSGVVALPDGMELRRGTLIGPVGDGDPGMVAQARTPVRVWVLPDASGLPPLLGSGQRAPGTRPVAPGRTAPGVGTHPAGAYPPLAAPPAVPDGTEDPELDRRFERRTRRLVLAVLLFALALAASTFVPGPAWAEMPADQALLAVDRGRATAGSGDISAQLGAGDRRYVGRGARIAVTDGSIARLTFPGGAAMVLCSGSRIEVGALHSGIGRPRDPHAEVAVDAGRVLADTTSMSGAYRPLALIIRRPQGAVTSAGAAWYAVDPGAVAVATGRVSTAEQPVPAAGGAPACGDGVPVTPPAALPTASSSGPSPAPSVVASVPTTPPPAIEAPVARPAPTTRPPTSAPTRTTPRSPAPTTTTTPAPTTTSPPPPTTAPPPPSPTNTTTQPPATPPTD